MAKKKVLDLVLKAKWYDMIAEGKKREEYREIKPYWCKRLLNTSYKNKEWEAQLQFMQRNNYVNSLLNWYKVVPYTHIRFHRGYTSTTMTFSIGRFDVRTGNPEWGAEPNKLYFTFSILTMLGQSA